MCKVWWPWARGRGSLKGEWLECKKKNQRKKKHEAIGQESKDKHFEPITMALVVSFLERIGAISSNSSNRRAALQHKLASGRGNCATG